MKLVNTVATTLIFTLAFSTVSTASTVRDQYLAMDVDNVVDLKTVDGNVVTIDELRDGYSQVSETKVVGRKLLTKRSAPIVDMQLFNGQIIDFQTARTMMMGGDMGGGGKGGAKLQLLSECDFDVLKKNGRAGPLNRPSGAVRFLFKY